MLHMVKWSYFAEPTGTLYLNSTQIHQVSFSCRNYLFLAEILDIEGLLTLSY